MTFLIGCKKSRYIQDIIYLESFIRDNEPSKENFDFIFARFRDLTENNWNHKRTAKAFTMFSFKYKSFWDAIVLETEEEINKVIELRSVIMS
jgi:hypothetical protein